MKEIKRYGLIIMGKKPAYFDTWEQRQTVIKNVKGLLTYTTFTAKKGSEKMKPIEKFTDKGINKHTTWKFRENGRELYIDKNHDVLEPNFYIYERKKDSMTFGGEGCGTIWYPTLEATKAEIERLFKTGDPVKTGADFNLCKRCKCSYSYKTEKWEKAEKEFLCKNAKTEYVNKLIKTERKTL